MNKIKLILLISLFTILTGCHKNENIIDKFIEKTDKLNTYQINGDMKIKTGEDTYSYNVEVNYKKQNYYKVKIINKNNNHEQIILKNDDGVYVITPALNKSFSFQCDWPNNGSQSYLLSSIIKDIKATKNKEITNNKNNIIIKTDVNYPNNSNLKYQKIYLDKKSNLKKVEVFNNEDNIIIEMNFNKINLNKHFTKNNFKLEKYTQEQIENTKDEETSVIENIVYPLYLPADTKLESKDTVETNEGDRVIMTYSGKKPFMIIEELSKPNKEMEVTKIYGDPLFLSNTIGALSSNSIEWQSNNMNYYLSSSYLTKEEMMTIAESLNTSQVAIIKNDK